MTEKERYASIGTWVEVFREEGISIGYSVVRKRLGKTGIIGETVRNQFGRVLIHGFYGESHVREACSDILDQTEALDFTAPEKVHADLISLASQLDEGETPFDLSTGNVPSLSIVCHNGQMMTGRAYLSKAAVALGFAKDSVEANSQQAKTIKRLLKIAGFDIFDEDYFQDSEKVRADLLAFATQLGENKAPLDLSTSNMPSLSVICHNGRVMTGERYLGNAVRALGFADNTKKASSKYAYILNHLFRMAGFKPFDEDYFQNSEYLRIDLLCFASQIGQDKSPLDLNSSNIQTCSISCQNGQAMKGRAYLSTAAIVLGFAENAKGANRQLVHTLRHLLKIAGFEPFDQDYFLDPEIIKADFSAFATQLGNDEALLELTARNIRSISITCQNGQLMMGRTYLNAAAKAMGLARTSEEATSKGGQIFDTLKKIAGYLTPSHD